MLKIGDILTNRRTEHLVEITNIKKASDGVYYCFGSVDKSEHFEGGALSLKYLMENYKHSNKIIEILYGKEKEEI